MAQNRAFHALNVDNILYDQAHWGMYMDTAPYDNLDVTQFYRKWVQKALKIPVNGKVFNDIDYGKFALARFCEANHPIPMAPADLQKAETNRYSLKDGRTLFVTRSAPTTMRRQFTDGSVLVELDTFEGWKNDKLLMASYAPHFLDNQLDTPPSSH